MRLDEEDAYFLPQNMKKRADSGQGVYRAFEAYESGEDRSLVEQHAILDFPYARGYAKNLLAHLRRIGLPAGGAVLDVGCALGTVTGALKSVLGPDAAVSGIDLSEAALRAAGKTYPDCEFSVCSADDLSVFNDGSLDLIHAREFYPFTRTANTDFHMSFLSEFARKLKPGGAAVAVQIIERRGLANDLANLRRCCADAGYAGTGRRVMVPLRFYRHMGAAAYGPALYPLFAFAGLWLERIRPGRVGYLYYFRKAADL